MPLTTYSPRVQHEGYDLINQAFNRFVAGQMPKPALGGGGAGPSGDTAGQLSQGPPQQEQPSLQGGPQQQVPDFFNRPQTPAYQPPGGSIAAGGALNQNPALPGAQQPQQGGLGNLGQLLALLGPLQSGQGFLPGIMGGQRGYQKPALLPSLLQQQAQQYGNPTGTPLEALFNPQSYGGPAQYGMSPQIGGGGRIRDSRNGVVQGPALNPQIQQQALSYILQQLAMGGMPQGQQPGA